MANIMDGLNPQFLGGAVTRLRAKLDGLLDELLDAPQLQMLDEIIEKLENRRGQAGKKNDYKPGVLHGFLQGDSYEENRG